MASDLQRYRAQFFQISGFAFMTPLGKFILDLKDIKLEQVGIWFFVYLVFSLLLAYCGIIFLLKGEEHLND